MQRTLCVVDEVHEPYETQVGKYNRPCFDCYVFDSYIPVSPAACKEKHTNMLWSSDYLWKLSYFPFPFLLCVVVEYYYLVYSFAVLVTIIPKRRVFPVHAPAVGVSRVEQTTVMSRHSQSTLLFLKTCWIRSIQQCRYTFDSNLSPILTCMLQATSINLDPVRICS